MFDVRFLPVTGNVELVSLGLDLFNLDSHVGYKSQMLFFLASGKRTKKNHIQLPVIYTKLCIQVL